MRDVHCCEPVFYQQIENGTVANQIHRFTIDYGRFKLKAVIVHHQIFLCRHWSKLITWYDLAWALSVNRMP